MTDGSESEGSVGRTFRRFLDTMDRLLNPEPEQPAPTTPARAPDAVYWDAVYGADSTKIDMKRVHRLAFAGVPASLRAVYWKLLLGYLPPERDLWPSVLQESRHSYRFLLDKLLTDPEQATDTDHPLSVSSESTWQTHFQDQELQEVIERDVLRTLPTLHFFSTPERVCSEHGAALIRVLFVYAKTNSPIRYVQGMNEVLAPLYYVFATTGAEAERAHAEADAFACFARLMGETNDIFNKARDKDMLNPDSTVGRYQALLARLDPALYRDLAAKGVDPRFYALRWLSLLFSQELPLADVERLWDSLFADEDRFTFLLFFACTIVIERRTQILASDFSRTLYLLQNLRVDAIQDTITYADRLMKFTNPDHLNPHVMADYMRELSRQDAPSGADLLERDSKALQSEIKHQHERTPSASSPTPHESTDTPHRGALPGSLPDEFCTLAWHDSHDSS